MCTFLNRVNLSFSTYRFTKSDLYVDYIIQIPHSYSQTLSLGYSELLISRKIFSSEMFPECSNSTTSLVKSHRTFFSLPLALITLMYGSLVPLWWIVYSYYSFMTNGVFFTIYHPDSIPPPTFVFPQLVSLIQLELLIGDASLICSVRLTFLSMSRSLTFRPVFTSTIVVTSNSLPLSQTLDLPVEDHISYLVLLTGNIGNVFLLYW